MSDEKWQMPDWMRDVLVATDDRLVVLIEQAKNTPIAERSSVMDEYVARTIALQDARAAGLLLTLEQAADVQVTENSLNELHALYDGLAAKRDRLRAENERLRRALNNLIPWASKAVADHPYNKTIGRRALDAADAALGGE